MRKAIVLLVSIVLLANQLSVLEAAELQPVEAFNNALLVESSVISLCAAATVPLQLVKKFIYQTPSLFAVIDTASSPAEQKQEDPVKNTQGTLPGLSLSVSQEIKPCFTKIAGHIAAWYGECVQPISPGSGPSVPAGSTGLFVWAILVYIIILSRANLPAPVLINFREQKYPTRR